MADCKLKLRQEELRMSSDKKDEGAGVPLSPDVDEEESTGYKPPAEKSLAEIVNADAEDESLVR